MSYSKTIYQVSNVTVCRIPNVTTTKGHYFGSWKDKIWHGNLKIMNQDQQVWVDLVNYDNTPYAKAMMPPSYKDGVQKAIDSSRGYALRLTNEDGRAMWVGLKFHDRNQAFDFYTTFDWLWKQFDRENNPQDISKGQDFAFGSKLAPGQKINIGGSTS